MPASYVHQCVADAACDALSLYTDATLRSAVRAGSEGPDPFFYSLFSLPGQTVAPKLGSVLHTQKTDAVRRLRRERAHPRLRLRLSHPLRDGHHVPSVRLRALADRGGRIFQHAALHA